MADPDDAKRQLPAIFFEIHNGLPREGPGDAASTIRACRAVPKLSPTANLLDVGCGPGSQTLDLAQHTAARIVALDNHRPYLDQLRDRVDAVALGHRVDAIRASMFEMPFRSGSFDLIWAEGSIYILGFERGLREWRRLLRPGGCMALTHLSWLRSDAPDEPRAFWRRGYPQMRTVDENIEIVDRCGFDLLDCFPLPESAWWTDYYGPMESRLASLRARYRGDEEAAAVIEDTQEQIDLYRRFAASYGYVFYVLRLR